MFFVLKLLILLQVPIYDIVLKIVMICIKFNLNGLNVLRRSIVCLSILLSVHKTT